VESTATEGDSPVWAAGETSAPGQESGCLGLQSKAGGKLHLRLNTDKRPIANKYREGKLKRTLKKELKVREIASREAIGTAEPSVLSRRHTSFWSSVHIFHLDSLIVLVCCPCGQTSRAVGLRRPNRPVLKHGPRSSVSMRVLQLPH
jgi:hypothetical protein